MPQNRSLILRLRPTKGIRFRRFTALLSEAKLQTASICEMPGNTPEYRLLQASLKFSCRARQGKKPAASKGNESRNPKL